MPARWRTRSLACSLAHLTLLHIENKGGGVTAGKMADERIHFSARRKPTPLSPFSSFPRDVLSWTPPTLLPRPT